MKKTAVFRSDLFMEHMKNVDHPESAERLRVIYDEIDRPEYEGAFIRPEFQAAAEDILRLNHDAAYIKRLAATAGEPCAFLDADTQTTARSYEAACLAAGAAVGAVELVLTGGADNAFCLVRPPGHHAEADKAMGFCLLNNAALAARFALKKMGLKRVMIVDWDLHHGNGTQHSFYDTDRVLYFSTHQFPCYPGTGDFGETGAKLGKGCTVNVPLPVGLNDEAFASIYNELAGPIALQYRPELIIISAGYDIHRDDPLGGMMVTETGFAYMTKVLLDAAAECGCPVIACLEGGYDLRGLTNGVMATLAEMRGQSIMADKTIMELSTASMPLMAIEKVRSVAKRIWNL